MIELAALLRFKVDNDITLGDVVFSIEPARYGCNCEVNNHLSFFCDKLMNCDSYQPEFTERTHFQFL